MLRATTRAFRAARAAECSRGNGVRFASTTARAHIFSPAVTFLIHKHRIDSSVVSQIQATGPRGRLLKGDVLKFLAGHGNVALEGEGIADEGDSLIPQAYFTRDVIVNDLVAFLQSFNAKRGTNLTVSDFLTRATTLAIKAVPEVNAQFNEKEKKKAVLNDIQLAVSRVSPTGISSYLIRNPLEVGAIKLNKSFKDEGEKVLSAKGTFSVFDHLLAPPGDLTPYLPSHQTAILTIHPIRKVSPPSSPVKSDVFDILIGSSHRSGVVAPPKDPHLSAHVKPSKASSSYDEIDFLAQPAPGVVYRSTENVDLTAKYIVQVDLTVDPRAVPAKVAEKFLKEWEDLVMKGKPEKIYL